MDLKTQHTVTSSGPQTDCSVTELHHTEEVGNCPTKNIEDPLVKKKKSKPRRRNRSKLKREAALKQLSEQQNESLLQEQKFTSESEVEMMKLKNENQGLRDELVNLQQQLDATNASILTQTTTEEQLQKVIVEYRQRIQDLEFELQEEKTSKKNVAKFKVELQEKECMLTSMRENFDANTQQLQKDQNVLIEQINSLVAEMKKIKDQVHEKEFVISNLKKELHDLQSKMDEQTNPFPLEIEHETTRKELNKLDWRNKELELKLKPTALEQYAEAQDDLSLMENMLDSTTENLDGIPQQQQQDQNVLIEQNLSLVAEMKGMTNQMCGKDLESISLNEKLSNLKLLPTSDSQSNEDDGPVTEDGCEPGEALSSTDVPSVELQAGTNTSSAQAGGFWSRCAQTLFSRRVVVSSACVAAPILAYMVVRGHPSFSN